VAFIEPDGMLNGWNRKVRITSAISNALMTTRMVSPTPLSVLVPDVTLIAFPIPVAIAAPLVMCLTRKWRRDEKRL